MEVLPGSPVFSNPGTAATANNGVPTSDQRGVSRGAVELGAYQATTAGQLAVSGFPSLVTAGAVKTATVTAEDAFGKTVYNYAGTLSFTATGAANLPAPTPVTGGWTMFGAALDSAGVQALTVSDGTISGTQNGILVAAAAAAQIVAFSGAVQSTTVATAFAPLQALVTDPFNNPVSGASVTFTLPGNTALPSVSTINGIAAASLTAGQGAGTFTVTASVAGVSSPAQFVLTSTPAAPASINVGGTPQIAPIGTAFTNLLQARISDRFGNAIANVPVAFAAQPGPTGASGAFAAFSTVTTNAQGIATAPALTANYLEGAFTVTAAVAGVSTPGTFSLTNTDVPAAIRVVQGSSQRATVGTAYSLPLAVLVTDSAGQPVSGIPVFFTLPAAGAGGTLAHNVFLTNAQGFAVTTALTANDTAGTFTIIASVASLSSPARFTLTNRPLGPAAVNVFAGSPQTATVGKAFPNRLQAQVIDKFGNPLSGVTVTFTAPASAAGGRFAGKLTATAVTGANGVATAPVLTANSVTGDFSVTASIKGVNPPASFSLTNQAASGHSLVKLSELRKSVASGAALSAAVPQTPASRSAASGILGPLVGRALDNRISEAAAIFTVHVGLRDTRRGDI